MKLLPADTLKKVRVGFSASASADLAQLGLLEDHFRLALGELARTVLTLGGSLQYCGHLQPDGYTTFLVGELKRYGRRGDPLAVVLAWAVHRRLKLSELTNAKRDLGMIGTLTTLSPEGEPIDFKLNREEAAPGLAPEEVAPSLTAMRRHAAKHAQGRLFVGGQLSGYQGTMPGIWEEAVLAIEAGQPLFLAGGFGGATHELVRQVDEGAAAWLERRAGPALADGAQAGLERFHAAAVGGWDALANGLEADENRQLAATHRPSEIAALVSLGLGRLAEAGKLG